MEEKVKLHLDTIGYKEKPTNDDMAIIKNRVQRDSPPVEVTLKELIEAIQEGKAVSPAVMKGTKAKDFIQQQVFMVDIDNTNTQEPILQVADAISICEKNGLHVAFYYYSFSHTEELPKYRLVFILDETITDNIIRLSIMQRLIDLFKQADKSCKNADRIFFGTDKETVICDLKARINVDTVLKISLKPTMEKRDKSYIGKTDSELDKLKRDFDFLSYLKERNGNVVRDNPRYIMFENCEICGHHNDLVYYPETNSFNCFSDDGNIGGTIIDYLMAVEHITLKQAIKKFRKELCRKMSKKLKIIRMSDVKLEKVKWSWYPYIPAGKVTLLYGNPRRW